MRQAIPDFRNPTLLDSRTFAGLCAARDWLAANFDGLAPLDLVAAQAGLSAFHFHRLFTHAFGETPHEFLTRLRIDKARRLLLSDHQSVTEICFEVGYQSVGSFSARFRSLTGLPPSEFRRAGRRVFGFPRRWPLYYIPACYQQLFF